MKVVDSSFSLFLRTFFVYLPISLLCIYQVLLYCQNTQSALLRLEQKLEKLKESRSSRDDFLVRDELSETIVIGLVACGSGHVRISELSVVLKSAIFFSKNPIKFVIFADKLKSDIVELLTKWNNSGKFAPIDWDIREPSYPEGSEAMVSMFVPCATQRLFFPEILTEYSRILYLDTDFVFFNSPLNTWNYFKQMDQDNKDVGMSLENFDSTYSLFSYATHPSPEDGGLNSGLMLMNLEGLRKSLWAKAILTINEELAPFNVFGDQDLINTLFHYFPDLYYLLPCTANVRLDFCLPQNVSDACPQMSPFVLQSTPVNDVSQTKPINDVSQTTPINDVSKTINNSLPLMLHGSRGAFHENWKLWDVKFLTTYFPNMINWFVVKNIHLLEYAYRVQPVMANQAFFKIAFKVFLDFDILTGDTSELKQQLSIGLSQMTSNDVCYEVKDFIVDVIKQK